MPEVLGEDFAIRITASASCCSCSWCVPSKAPCLLLLTEALQTLLGPSLLSLAVMGIEPWVWCWKPSALTTTLCRSEGPSAERHWKQDFEKYKC